MSYTPIDADIAAEGVPLGGAISRTLIDNAAEHAQTRLRRYGATWPGHDTTESDYTIVEASDIVGPQGVYGYTNPGDGPETGAVEALRGLQFSTPADTPLTVRIPWPMSAHARRIRVVICSSLFGRGTDRAMQVVGQVYTGGRFYPRRYVAGDLDVAAEASTYGSADLREWSPEVMAGDNATEIGGDVTAEGVRWDAIEIDLSERPEPARDDTAMRDGDAEGRSYVLLHFLSLPRDLENESYRVALSGDLESLDDGLVCRDNSSSHTLPKKYPAQNVGSFHRLLALPAVQPGASPIRLAYVTQIAVPRNDFGSGQTDYRIWPPMPPGYDPASNVSGGTTYAIENVAALVYSVTIQELP